MSQILMRKQLAGIQPERGFAFIVPTFLRALSSHQSPSRARVLEDGNPLPGPANASHEDIRQKGLGRFSFWYDQLYFSTPDNSSPLTNGRCYEIEYSSADGAKFISFLRLIRDKVHNLTGFDVRRASPPVNFLEPDSSPQRLQHDVEYATQVGQNFVDWLPQESASLVGKVVLEIGPGINFGSTLLMACLGARAMVADPYLAPWIPGYHDKFYALLRDWVKANLSGADLTPLDRILARGGYLRESIGYYVTGLEQLAGIPDSSVDIVFSNAVLEHLANPASAFRQLARVSKPEALGFHQVDFRDHSDFTKPLEFLLVEDKQYAKEFERNHGERGNRFRALDYLELFEKVGFEVLRFEPNIYTEKKYLEDFVPRLRAASGSKYKDAPGDSLHELSGLFRVKRASIVDIQQ